MKPIETWTDKDKQNILEAISDWVEQYDVRSGEQAGQDDSIQISGYELVCTLGDVAGLGYDE